MSPGAEKQPFGGVRQHVGARIAHLVDAMSEAHQLPAGVDLPAQDLGGPGCVADLEHHVERRSGGAAVQRPLECAQCANHRRHQIRSGRARGRP
jgi:hypothetical protein